MKVRLGLLVLCVLGLLSVAVPAPAELPYYLPGSALPSGGVVKGEVAFSPSDPLQPLVISGLTYTGHIGNVPNINGYGAIDFNGSFSIGAHTLSVELGHCTQPACVDGARYTAYDHFPISASDGTQFFSGECGIVSANWSPPTLAISLSCTVSFNHNTEVFFAPTASAIYLRDGSTFKGRWSW